MSRILTRCPWCSRVFGLTTRGYTQMHSDLSAHMMGCDKRPPGVSDAAVVEEADRLMAKTRGDEK